jgi:hypothetical protein
MTVRRPLKFRSRSPNLATGDTYEFYGVVSNAVVFKTNLLRYTLAEANSIISKLDLSAFSAAGLSTPSNFNLYDIDMDGQPDGGYIFLETQDDSGNALTPWRPWWPKYSNRNVYYLQPASNNSNNYQFPGNFTTSQVRQYYSIDERNQELQEEPNVNYIVGLVIDKWFRTQRTADFTNTYGNPSTTIEGVELRLPHTFKFGTQGYTVAAQYNGNITSWSSYSRSYLNDYTGYEFTGTASVLSLYTHIGVSSPGSTATLHPYVNGPSDTIRDTRYKASYGVLLASPPYAECIDPPLKQYPEGTFGVQGIATFSKGAVFQNIEILIPGRGADPVINVIEFWYKTLGPDPKRVPDIGGLRYWVSLYYSGMDFFVLKETIRVALVEAFNVYGYVTDYYSYCQWQEKQGLLTPSGVPPASQGVVELVSTAHHGVDQWVQPSNYYPGYTEAYRPMYYSNGELRSMSDADIDDTFIKPAIKCIMGESTLPNVDESLLPYTITTSSTSPSGWSRMTTGGGVSRTTANSVIFTDTVANTTAYSNFNLSAYSPDFYQTQTEYYLHKKNYFGSVNQLSSGNFTWVRYDNSTKSIIEMTSDELATYMYERFKHVIATVPSWRIRYTFHLSNSSASSNYSYQSRAALGTYMTDTSTNGNATNLFIQYGADDYRYMSVPTGSKGTITQYRLYAVRY